MFRQKCFQKQLFSTLHTYYICKVKSIIGGLVICEYDTKGWLACVLQVNDSEIYIILCIPLPPVSPSSPDSVCIPVSEVLTSVDSKTATCHTYVISENESYCTTGNKKPGFVDSK
jgi:hypothetical protein